MSIEFHFHLCFEGLPVCAVSFFELAKKHFHECISVYKTVFSILLQFHTLQLDFVASLFFQVFFFFKLDTRVRNSLARFCKRSLIICRVLA